MTTATAGPAIPAEAERDLQEQDKSFYPYGYINYWTEERPGVRGGEVTAVHFHQQPSEMGALPKDQPAVLTLEHRTDNRHIPEPGATGEATIRLGLERGNPRLVHVGYRVIARETRAPQRWVGSPPANSYVKETVKLSLDIRTFHEIRHGFNQDQTRAVAREITNIDRDWGIHFYRERTEYDNQTE